MWGQESLEQVVWSLKMIQYYYGDYIQSQNLLYVLILAIAYTLY